MQGKDEYVAQLNAVHERVRREVFRREGGRCLLCGRPATEIHEIEHRSHHAFSKQLEARTFSLENCCALCRTHHQEIGQHKNSPWMFRYLLHARYNYPMPELAQEMA